MGLRSKKLIIILLIFSYSLIVAIKCNAAWNGPTEILSGTWGSATGQFGINYGDSGDRVPDMIVISTSGKILIGDSFNKKIQVFNADGTFRNLITPKGFPSSYPAVIEWPLSLFICGDQNIYTERNEYTQIYALDGSFTQNLTNLDGGINYIDKQCNIYTYNPGAKRYCFYSPTGQLIKTSTTRPLELGDVRESALGNGKYKVTVKYPDREWVIIGDGIEPPYMRDVNGNLYSTGGTQAIRWNFCGKELARLTIPEGKEGDDFEEYGEAVVAPNGDVYTWKRTEEKYSIVKWTWVDDPNAPVGPDVPTNLTAAASTTGLYLTWKASPQDPGCVSGYEISRSITSGGTYTVLTTVANGVLNYNDTTAEVGTTYYYKLRAKAGNDFSPYTAAASGKK